MAVTQTEQNVRAELADLAEWWLGSLATGDLMKDLYGIRAVREHLDATPKIKVGGKTFDAFERFQDLVKRAGFDPSTLRDLTANWFHAKQAPPMRHASDRMYDGINALVAQAKEIEQRVAQGRNLTEHQAANLARQHTEIVGQLSRVASDPSGRYKLRDMSAAAGLRFDQGETGTTVPAEPIVAIGGDARTGAADVDAIRAENQRGLGGDGGVTTATDDTIETATGTGGGATGTFGTDETLAADGTPRQIPGGGELWLVDGREYYLAYTIPGTRTPLLWKVESHDRLRAIYGTAVPEVNKELTGSELKRLSPWQMGGLSAEIANTSEDPWQVFLSEFEKAATLRPWLNDPSTLAVISVAYLEGRAPTQDELSQTDWWNNHTADERAWMEKTATVGREEVERLRDDAARGVAEALRKAGMANPTKAVTDYIAEQRLTGRWSETHTTEQIRKITDPFAPGKLDRGLLASLRDPAVSDPADMRALSLGREAVMDRVRDIFTNARVPIESERERAGARLDRIASEIMSGRRSFADVRHSIDLLAAKTSGGRPGGLDVTTKGEDRVRQLVREWVGPSVAQGYDDQWIAEWAGRLRNDEDAEQELVSTLQGARLAAFGNWNDPNVRYADIAPVARSLYSRIWGTSPDETDPLFLDIVNMTDQNAAAQKLRTEGLSRGVGRVVDDALAGLSATALGEQVIRSSV